MLILSVFLSVRPDRREPKDGITGRSVQSGTGFDGAGSASDETKDTRDHPQELRGDVCMIDGITIHVKPNAYHSLIDPLPSLQGAGEDQTAHRGAASEGGGEGGGDREKESRYWLVLRDRLS